MTPTLPEKSTLDYNFLRQEGIRHLERLAGPLWTDFNLHDPGITILEQLCYALTDLSYRINYDLKDLLADGESKPYRSLYSPAEILTTNPVTLTDLRKVVIDVDGVKNAWIEPVEDVQPAVYYDPCDGSLYLEAAPHREPVPVRGVYRVLIERDGSLKAASDAELKKAVNQRLHECRNLGQDFIPAEILTEQRITVTATIEVSAVDDADRLLAEIYHALARCISPRIRFYTLAEMLARGKRIDEIMDGPVLEHGFIDTDELECFERKTGLRTSDLIQEIMNVKGVSAVNDIKLSGGTKTDELWYLKLDKDKTPVLVIDKIQLDKIQLIRGGITALSNPDRVKKFFEDLQQADRVGPLPEAKRDIRLSAGRDRQVGRYYSIQQQFPAVYGIGELSLPASAPALRQAQARQLKAYLLFFDQLLANYFAQLANVKKLFSFDSSQPQTYFSQVIDDPRLGLDDIWKNPTNRAAKLQKITEDPRKITKDFQKITENFQVACERKNRFLNHLLARFAEDFTDYSLSQFAHASPEDLIKAKCAFLQDYRELGAARGRAFNYTSPAWDTDNVSGLEKRISRKLGLSSYRDEGGFHIVEHILLRPCQADLAAMKQATEVGSWQAGVLLALPEEKNQPQHKDPYSRQISFIFPAWVTRFDERLFGDFIRQTLREETPAHLHVHPLWLSQEDMPAFESAYQDWLGNLGMDTGNTKVRDARDRLIDWLRMGTPYPLRDLELKYVPMVALEQQADIHILGAQTGVRYILCDENGDPIVDGQGKPLFSVLRETSQAADQVTLPTPKIVKDITFTILASRESNARGIPLQPPLETYLNKPVSIKAGIDTALQVTFASAEGQSVTDHQITINYKDTVTVAIEASQAGISYKLVDAKENDISASEQGKKEAKITLKSNVLMEDIEITIKAFRTLEPNTTADLKTKLSVKVRPNPVVAVSVEPSPIDYAEQTTLTLTGTQSSVSYQLFKRELTVADYPSTPTDKAEEVLNGIVNRGDESTFTAGESFTEDSGKWSASTGQLEEDTLFIVQATKKDNKEALWLAQARVVLVRPNTAPTVGVKAKSISANTEGMVTVSGTQKGVMYQLRLNGTPVNEPGFHWGDRGIETMRIEVDFVVEAPTDQKDYQTLLLPTGVLKTTTTFNVLATKILTGLSAQLNDAVTISIG